MSSLTESRVRDGLDVVNAALDGQQYLLGDDFSAADVMMGYTVALMEFLMLPQHQHLTNYLARLKTRPGFKAAFGKLPTA